MTDRLRNTRHWWQTLLTYYLPVAVIYQLLWGGIFKLGTAGVWNDGHFTLLIITKLASELLLYSVMWWMLLKQHAHNRLSIVVVGVLFTGILSLTARGLFTAMG